MRVRGRRLVAPVILAGVVIALAPASRGREPAAAQRSGWTDAARRDALARAVVWQPPAVPIAKASLATPAHGLPDEVTCTFRMTPAHGTIRKFTCDLPSGESIRVKYSGPEPHGEVAASTLLTALGFGADRVRFVRHVRCKGCPWAPFETMAAVTLARAEGLYEAVARHDGEVAFDWVAVERRFEGEQITTPQVEGWTFDEFSRLATASPTHADALRLMAVFLAHWDNKSENQRLVCLSGPPDANGRCARPFAMLQDVGATFGPRKVNLARWREAPIWTDRSRCEIGMPDMPHGGATFVPVRVSESGRQFLTQKLQALSRQQLTDLFSGARFEPRYGRVQDWVDAFVARVAQMADGPRCPS